MVKKRENMNKNTTNKIKNIIATIGIITVGSIVSCLTFYCFIFIIPQRLYFIVSTEPSAFSQALLIVTCIALLIYWFMWSIRNVELKEK